MGGTSKQSQTTSSQTNPWEPAIPGLKQLASGVTGQIGNAGLNSTETGALNTLAGNAAGGNPYADRISGVANDLLAGGPDRTGMVNDAYGTYKQQLTPWANGSMGDPMNNPALAQMLQTIQSDVGNSVNSQFAAAGRDMSGANQMAYGRGIAQGFAPAMLQAQQMGLTAANDLYGGGLQAGGVLSGLDQTKLGNQQAGIGAADQALQARDSGANQQLAVEALRRGMPLENYANIAGILGPLGQLGGSQQGTAEGTSKMSGAQQFALLGQGAAGWGKFLFG
jgi:hypothetical protein